MPFTRITWVDKEITLSFHPSYDETNIILGDIPGHYEHVENYIQPSEIDERLAWYDNKVNNYYEQPVYVAYMFAGDLIRLLGPDILVNEYDPSDW